MTVKHNLSNYMAEEVIEQQEATTPDEELELEQQPDDTDDVEALKDELAKEREAKRQILARAKKAEEQLKAKPSQPSQPVEQKPSQPASSLDIEETVLLANGMDEELLGELKAIAQVRKVSLIKAQADPIFVAVKEKFEKEQKQKNASLPASRGSAQVKARKDFKTVGLTAEEHRQMFNEKFSK